MSLKFSYLEMGGGQVLEQGVNYWRLALPAFSLLDSIRYADAQLHDYAGIKRAQYPHTVGTTLQLQARFSHEPDQLVGTAGFGFWNAPFGDPTVPLPALPQAVWFFFASPPNDFPLAHEQPGRGWFAGTIDAGTFRALSLTPFAPIALLLNQFSPLRRRLMPPIQQQLGISFQPITHSLTAWHEYGLSWQPDGCSFSIDGEIVLQTPHSPRGPLGFVCWLDNQFMVLTSRGRVNAGILPVPQPQWLDVKNVVIRER
jgi:hypothetical protein